MHAVVFKKTKNRGHHDFKLLFVTRMYSEEWTLSLGQYLIWNISLMFFNARKMNYQKSEEPLSTPAFLLAIDCWVWSYCGVLFRTFDRNRVYIDEVSTGAKFPSWADDIFKLWRSRSIWNLHLTYTIHKLTLYFCSYFVNLLESRFT